MFRLPSSLLSGVTCWRLLASGLILLAALLHLAYLAFACPLDLAPDEAHYWDWSRRLDWSYYSKGPLVAYLIRGGCLLFGDLSRQLTGTEAMAVRLPAVACGTLLLASLYILTVQVYGRERLACGVVAMALTLPLIAAGSTLMTIDAPYACCWGWALVLAHRAVFRRSLASWLAAGLVVGLGILAKYTMILFLPSVGLFLLTSPEHRRQILRPGFWLMSLIAGLCCFPILIWNMQHDWVTLRHVGRQAGTQSGSGVFWIGPLIYVGTQAAMLLGFWFVAWIAALWRHRPWSERDAGIRYLWWTSAVMFGVFLAFSVKTRGGEPNWPVTAYLSGLVLSVGWIARQLAEGKGWPRRVLTSSLTTACLLGGVLTLLIHRSDLIYPLLAQIAGPPTGERPLPLRRFDPTCRLRGWRVLGQEVDQVRTQLREEGVEAVVAGTGWAMPGALGFYTSGHPEVYSVGPVLGDRRSQYDLWRPNPVADGREFLGKTFVIVGGYSPEFRSAFDRVEPAIVVTHRERGHPIASWTVTVCRGFQGFAKPEGERGD